MEERRRDGDGDGARVLYSAGSGTKGGPRHGVCQSKRHVNLLGSRSHVVIERNDLDVTRVAHAAEELGQLSCYVLLAGVAYQGHRSVAGGGWAG